MVGFWWRSAFRGAYARGRRGRANQGSRAPFRPQVTALEERCLLATIDTFPIPTPSSQPWGITAGPDGALWFTEGNANQIGRITPDGAIAEFPIPTADNFPLGITAGPDGNLWFTESGFQGNKIARFIPYIRVNPAAADHFAILAPASAASGVPFDLTVTAVDPFGNTDTSYRGTVTFTTSDPDPGVILPADYTFTANDAGTHTFTNTGPGETTLITVGDQTITASDPAGGLTGSATVTVGGGRGAAPGRGLEALLVRSAVAAGAVPVPPTSPGPLDPAAPNTVPIPDGAPDSSSAKPAAARQMLLRDALLALHTGGAGERQRLDRFFGALGQDPYAWDSLTQTFSTP